MTAVAGPTPTPTPDPTALGPTSAPALTPFPFRTLPLEVRNAIYTLLFDKHAAAQAANPQILGTCHQVNHEATRLLYEECAAEVQVGSGGEGGVLVRPGVGSRAEGAGSGRGGEAEGLKALRRFEVVRVRVGGGGLAGGAEGEGEGEMEEGGRGVREGVREVCEVLRESRWLRSLCVDVEGGGVEQMLRQGGGRVGEEEQTMLLEPFRELRGLRDVEFRGRGVDQGWVEGVRGEMMRGRGGEGEGEEEVDLDAELAAWEDVEGSAM